MASLGVRTLDELIGRSDLLEVDDAIDHWKARGVDLTHILHFPALPEGAVRRRIKPPPPVLDDHLDWELLRRAELAVAHKQPVQIDIPIRNVNRCVGGVLSSKIAQRARRRRPADRHHPGPPARLGRAVVRRLAGARRELHAARRRQRLHRQGPVRRDAGRHAARRRDLRRRGERHHRQHGALRRHERPRVLPRPGRRALRGAQLRRARGRRGRRRPRLRVHDRRARRRARADRAQLRRRHERRPGLRARRARRVPRQGQRRDARPARGADRPTTRRRRAR